jgi:hypothetical protein
MRGERCPGEKGIYPKKIIKERNPGKYLGGSSCRMLAC